MPIQAAVPRFSAYFASIKVTLRNCGSYGRIGLLNPCPFGSEERSVAITYVIKSYIVNLLGCLLPIKMGASNLLNDRVSVEPRCYPVSPLREYVWRDYRLFEMWFIPQQLV